MDYQLTNKILFRAYCAKIAEQLGAIRTAKTGGKWWVISKDYAILTGQNGLFYQGKLLLIIANHTTFRQITDRALASLTKPDSLGTYLAWKPAWNWYKKKNSFIFILTALIFQVNSYSSITELLQLIHCADILPCLLWEGSTVKEQDGRLAVTSWHLNKRNFTSLPTEIW